MTTNCLKYQYQISKQRFYGLKIKTYMKPALKNLKIIYKKVMYYSRLHNRWHSAFSKKTVCWCFFLTV